ncbi:MAG TPA: hypothetical protein VKS81_05660, partial [Bacteroidota bacterium]|nr:hypothetical protein [Bacteroidota bacterium]
MPVTILKVEHYGSLGIMRSLGRLGVRTYGIDGNRESPGFRSRYCTGGYFLDLKSSTPQQIV